jgi:hypothetical protein
MHGFVDRARRPGQALRSGLGIFLCVCAVSPPLVEIACGQIVTPVGAEAPPTSDAGVVVGDDAGVSDRDGAVDGASCVGDLSDVGTGDFHISCTIQTTQTLLVALVNQRDFCDFADFWDLRMEAGVPIMEVDDGLGTYRELWSTGSAIDDGKPHALLVQRVAGTLSIRIDGVTTASTAAPVSLGHLPPVLVGRDICMGVDGTVALASTLANLCITSP